MEFTNSYFKDEVREGFYIPGMIKRSWAMQLEVLETVASICKKYSIKWFADCGTLIGTIRHGGFIPWDDDLDICMLREDYIRFNEVALKELPSEYRVVNFETEPEYDYFITRVVANDVINNTTEYLLQYHGFPYPAGIDIFPLDYLYPDEEQEKERRDRAVVLWKEAQKLSNRAQISRQIENIAKEYDGKDSTEVALMPFYFENNSHIYPIRCFDKVIAMPFENTYINVPAAYEEVLSIEYGNWYVANRKGGIHDYPYFIKQQKMLIDDVGTAPYCYMYNNDPDIVKELKELRHKHKMSVDDNERLFYTLELYHEKIFMILIKGNRADSVVLLEDCQQIAISIGTAIEKEYGEDTLTVKLLEEYCEMVYELHEAVLADDSIYVHREQDGFNKILYDIIDNYHKEVHKKKEILFMPALVNDWKFMKPLYDKMSSMDNCDVYVMPIPYAERADDGSVESINCDYELFPSELPLIKYNMYSFEDSHTDMIIIQNPFDEYESGFTVHPFFYTMNIYAYTDKLVYCQGFQVDDIDIEDEKAYANMIRCVICPGVMYSDEIYVPTDNMKFVYMDVLSKLPDYNREEWDKKIRVLSVDKSKANACSHDNRKKLLFYVGICDYYSEEEKALQWIEKCKDIFEQYKEKIDIIWAEEECMKDNIKEVCPEIYRKYLELKQKFVADNHSRIVSVSEAAAMISEFDGYYGSGGYLLNLCVREGIPVMVRNISNYVV